MATPEAPLPAWSLRLMAEVDGADERARQLMAGLDLEQLNWQPAAGKWSIGQCLDHISATNEAYLQAISSCFRGKPAQRVEEIKPGWFGRWFIRNYVEPTPQTKRAEAPKKIVPPARVERSVLDRFLRTNQTVRETIAQASAHDVNRIRFPNPLFSTFRFTVGTGLEIISKHEMRHLSQAERVRASVDFPASRDPASARQTTA